MKQEINPVVAYAVIALVVCLAAFGIFMRTGGFGPEQATPQSNPMPKEAGEFLAKFMTQGKKAAEEAKRKGIETFRVDVNAPTGSVTP